jgi:putative ABC transport system permease protein
MIDALALAWRSLRAAWARSVVVALGVAVAAFLPLVAWRGEAVVGDALRARARSTPIVVGRKGSDLELALGALYFRGRVRDPLSWADVERLRDRGDATVIPLHLGATSGGLPVVGTTLAYLDRRGLVVAEGRAPAVLGEAVVGAAAARARGLHPGDRVQTDQTDLYDLAGAYPTRLEVVGVLAPTGTADDDALLVDIKTTWLVGGALHGHAAQQGEADPGLFLFAEVDPSALGSFHLHGAASDWPVTAALLFPRDARAHDQLLGQLAVDERLQAVRPVEAVETVLGVAARALRVLRVMLGLVAAATLAFVGLVAALVVQLRRREVELMVRVGASRARVAAVLGTELGLLLLAGAALAVAATTAVLTLLRGVL